MAIGADRAILVETAEELQPLAVAKLLKALWPLVRPGGRLLYCTCSVFKAEGETQIQTFVQHNTDALILPSPGHFTPSNATSDASLRDNGMGEHDGFYYALLEKRSI